MTCGLHLPSVALLFQQNFCYHATRQFGYKKINLLGLKLMKRGYQNHSLTAVAKAAG
jgi:hypothetical protein